MKRFFAKILLYCYNQWHELPCVCNKCDSEMSEGYELPEITSDILEEPERPGEPMV